jgi:hypothetical protein
MADNANASIIASIKKQIEKTKKQSNPLPNDNKLVNHLQKVVTALESGNAKPTEVFRNIIQAKCYECAGDDHPKTCTINKCPLYSERPKSGKEKEDIKATKEVDPEMKLKRQANAEKARSGRKVSVKEAMELLEASTTVVTKGGKKILYSYKTPVAVKDGDTAIMTDTKHSTTTSKHINKFLDGIEATKKKQEWFDKQFGILD